MTKKNLPMVTTMTMMRDPFFKSSKEADQRLSEVVCPCDGHDTLHRLRLVAARFHGDVVVVESSRRLYALREADRRLGSAMEATVDVKASPTASPHCACSGANTPRLKTRALARRVTRILSS